MSRRRRIYEGKAKIFMKDRSERRSSTSRTTRPPSMRKSTRVIEGKGVLNNRI
jgi:hypothetical protein